MNLAGIQSAMVRAVSDRTPGRLIDEVRAPAGASAETRLDAYRGIVAGGHLAAVAKAYPVLREVLGDRYFDHLLAEPIARMGSDDRDLNRYGAFLPGMLGTLQREREELTDMPYLADLARLEWAVHESTLAADDPACDWTGFAASPPSAQTGSRLRLSKALRLLTVDWPVDAIWASHRGRPVPDKRRNGSIRLCVYRSGRFDAAVARLAIGDLRLLERIKRGATIAELGGMRNREADHVVRTLMDWIGRGWIAGHDLSVNDVR
jgi:hypothetical protein